MSATRSAPPHLGGPGPGPGPGPTPSLEQAKDQRGAVLRLWGYLRRQKMALIATGLMVAAGVGLNLLGPYLLGQAIDRYILPGDLPGLARISLLMLAVYILTSLLTWLQSYVMAGASQRMVRDIRDDLFTRLQRLPLAFYDRHLHGDLMSRLTNDVENLNQVFSDSITQIVSGVLSMAGIAAVMFSINAHLAAFSLLSVVAITLPANRLLARRIREGFRMQQAALGGLNGFIEETVTGQKVVKTYHREPLVIEEFEAANDSLRVAATKAQVFAGYIGPMMNCFNNLSLALVAGVGGGMAVRGMATVGTIASFISYTRQFGRPLSDIANLYSSLQSAMAGAERVFEVIDEAPDADATPGEASIEIQGDMRFEDVRFSYEKDAPVLKGFSLHVRPGQTVALIGPTGAGKTTVVNLLTRFYDIDSGHIFIDGRDIRDIPKDDLRRQLGIVLQDTFLFAGPVRENIRYGRLDASDEEVIAAAKLANADQFIHRLPEGYDTLLSERGSNLSQGQRQLLAIARAVLANPRILILDEATSSVDTRTEKHIQEAMLRLMEGRTSLVIAHRLSTIRDADQILVIVHGEIIERGSHAELMAREGFYYRLCAGLA
ncbi:MAG: ABC transporter ATP-binding protein [Armatimonadetes bacterium]|nr:ABC transporter ATP-binding protein [Armatimonadota bacterium]